jgi:hypothetical protein
LIGWSHADELAALESRCRQPACWFLGASGTNQV